MTLSIIRKKNINNDTKEIDVGICEVKKMIFELSDNKSCGNDGINAEHLKYASDRLPALLSLLINSMFYHGYLPVNMLRVTLVPIIKNKAQSISSFDNYRPIALATIMSKVIEKIIYNRIETLMTTTPNQYGFKKKHGTDQCIYVLKEVIDMYKSLDATVFVCYLDISKAFDRVNHDKLYRILDKKGVPGYIMRIIIFWYENQLFCIKWGDTTSQSFGVSNGVRQGGILSPHFFNVYIDELSITLNDCKTGCCLNNVLLNHIMYADDMALIAPSVKGLKLLIRLCEQVASRLDITFNSQKSVVMIYRSNMMKTYNFPKFYLNHRELKEVSEYRYLGYITTNDGTDDKDIWRQVRILYAQGNKMIRHFGKCSYPVKITLFKSYCTNMYVSHLWHSYRKGTLRKLQTAYHNILKQFMGLTKYDSSSMTCSVFNVKSCMSVLRNVIHKFMKRLSNSTNEIIINILKTSVKHTSNIWKHMYKQLYVNFV